MKVSSTSFLVILAVFLICSSFLLLFVGPEMIDTKFRYLDQKDRGPFGDAFGGTMGPIIAWIAAILTFAAFYIQYEANKEQRRQFKKQADDTFIERFENRFFEMVRIHRENVEEQNIQDIIHGRKVFTTYYFELRYIYLVLEKMHDENQPPTKLSDAELTNLAYLIFFFGIGHVTDSVFKHIAPEIEKLPFFNLTIKRLEKEKDNYGKVAAAIEEAKSKPWRDQPSHDALKISHNGKEATFRQIYQPFTGHGTKIGHYYRHLFQTVKYVDGQQHSLFTSDFKYSYVKILRAQLSNFEQVIFYYNSVSTLGEDWIKEKYIKDYKLIVNLPLSFADFGILPTKKFEDEIIEKPDFFDWNNLKDALSIHPGGLTI